MRDGGQAAFSSDHGGLVVIEVQPGFPGTGFFHFHVQEAVAACIAGTEFGIDLFDAWILLQQLQPFL